MDNGKYVRKVKKCRNPDAQKYLRQGSKDSFLIFPACISTSAATVLRRSAYFCDHQRAARLESMSHLITYK